LNLSLADEHVGDVTIPAQVMEYNQNVNFGALYRNVPKQTTRVEQKKSKEILIE
jgi:hypothetical protein